MVVGIDELLSQYPKSRPPLPERIAKIYSAHYKSNREGQTPASSIAQKLESWMHRKVASDVLPQSNGGHSTLEIGAGTLNQLRYEPVVGPYDIVEPFRSLFSDSPLISRVRNIYSDISEVPEGQQYSRITSIATFEHITNLPEVVARCGILLSSDGVLRAAIPSEGTILWTLGWRVTTGLEFWMKYGCDYGALMRHEHVNDAREIEEVLGFLFGDVECEVYGLAKALSLYRFYACTRPRVDRCQEYLEVRAREAAVPR